MSDSLKHSSNLAPVWDIFCDFDGTITFFDVTDSLLERFAQPEWTAIEEEWAQGRIGSKECLSRQVQLLDMSLAELDDHLNQIDVDPGFAAFLMAAQNRGFPITIVSDGLDYSIRSILNRHKIHGLPIFANKLHQAGERKWRITFPYAGRNCDFASGHCKCATIGRMQPTARRKVLLIGDGKSDFCAAEQANMVFAKGKLAEHCARKGLPHYAIEGFTDALPLLERFDPETADIR